MPRHDLEISGDRGSKRPCRECPRGTTNFSKMKEITAKELKQLMASGEKLVLVDTRTEQEHLAYALEGAKLIPYDEIKDRHMELDAPKDAKLIVYCRSGNRSAIAAKTLKLLGYTNVVNLKGGLLEWKDGTK